MNCLLCENKIYHFDEKDYQFCDKCVFKLETVENFIRDSGHHRLNLLRFAERSLKKNKPKED